MLKPIAAALVTILTAKVALATATHYDAVHGFSTTKNPHAGWSYSANGTLLSQTTLACGNANLPSWNNGAGVPHFAAVARNISGATISGCVDVVVPTDHLWLDPQQGYVDVIWTAPTAGAYRVRGDFLGIATDENAHNVDVKLNGMQSLFHATLATYQQMLPFSLKLTLAAGDTVAFETSVQADYSRLGTGLAAHITPLP